MSTTDMIKIADIKKELEEAQVDSLSNVCDKYRDDERPGVMTLVEKYDKIYIKYTTEVARTEQMKAYEKKYQAYEYIAGIDEVGRGPLAGPVVTCAVILPKDCNIL
ncbi:MAG: ribonuclease HII, partial [Lachnospiraceae bacterium]|nr:ribonuclease HII [Lachnospiraceae bacterium]